MRRRGPTPESLVLRSILQLLQWERIVAFRMNTGVAKYGTAEDPRFVPFGHPGMSDILAFPEGRVFWIEAKAGTKQSLKQKEFQALVEAAGHTYILAHSIDDVIPHLRAA